LAHNDKKIVFDCRLMDEKETGISRYSKAILSHYQERYGRENVTMIMNPHYCSISGPKIVTNLKPYNFIHFLFFHRILKSLPFDIYHAPFYSSAFFSINYGIKVPTVHDLMYEAVDSFFSKSRLINALKRLYIRAIVTPSIKNADMILAVSEATSRDLEKYFEPARIFVIPEGLNIIKESPDFSILDRYGLKKGEFFFYVGNDRPHKNLDFLVSTFQKARTLKKLVIAGNKQRNEDGKVLFIGRISEGELHALYASSSAFIYPSLYEGFGLPILEALSMGTKVFSSSSGALCEFGSKWVHYFSPINCDELRALIENCDQLERPEDKDLGELLSKYSWENYGRKLDLLLDAT